MSDTGSTPPTPAQRHLGRPRPDHTLFAPLRLLLPGDVTVHNDGSESVIISTERLPAGEYQYVSRTLRPPAQPHPRPAEYWQFPWTLRAPGRSAFQVAAHRHVDPASLPPAPYPPTPPGTFTDGDVVRKGTVTWERENGGWFNQVRTSSTQPTGDAAIRRLFRDDDTLRLGIPEYIPALLKPTRPHALTDTTSDDRRL